MRRWTEPSASDRRRAAAVAAAATERRMVLRSEPCPRRALAAAAEAGGYSHATLSRAIGREDGYVGRFIRDGCPLALNPAEHQQLADFLGLPPARLGIRDLWRAAA